MLVRVGRVHGVIRTIYGTGIGATSNIVFVANNVPELAGSGDIAYGISEEQTIEVMNNRASGWKGFTCLATVETGINSPVILEIRK
jgi:hypothetical protein